MLRKKVSVMILIYFLCFLLLEISPSFQQDQQTDCAYVFRSDEKTEGVITSPNYPEFYPKNSYCTYEFYGHPPQTVRIVFSDFNVEGIPPRCGIATQSDYVEFSDYRTVVDRSRPRMCGFDTHVNSIESAGSYFRVVFASNDVYDGRGFSATYTFMDNGDPTLDVM